MRPLKFRPHNAHLPDKWNTQSIQLIFHVCHAMWRAVHVDHVGNNLELLIFHKLLSYISDEKPFNGLNIQALRACTLEASATSTSTGKPNQAVAVKKLA
ncbi:MAG: hypothetical protein RJB14_28 [Pseudomonadota bacterium]